MEKNKMKRLNNLISMVYESSILQEEYEKNQELIVNTGSSDTDNLELFDI